jgi:hypothetical protein
VMWWRCGDVGLLGGNLLGETVFTYSDSSAGKRRSSDEG